MSSRVRSEIARTRAARRAERGTTVRKTRRSQALITEGSRSNERSWTVSTAGHGQPGGITCRKWASSGRDAGAAGAAGARPSAAPGCAAGERERLDSRRDERRVARHRGEAERPARLPAARAGARARRSRRRCDGGRGRRRRRRSRGRLASRPRPSSAAARSHVKPLARSSPSGPQLLPPRRGLLDPGGDRLGVERVDEHRRAARRLGRARPVARHDGGAAGHRLEHRDPEALVERRVGEAAGAAVEAGELVVARPRRAA